MVASSSIWFCPQRTAMVTAKSLGGSLSGRFVLGQEFLGERHERNLALPLEASLRTAVYSLLRRLLLRRDPVRELHGLLIVGCRLHQAQTLGGELDERHDREREDRQGDEHLEQGEARLRPAATPSVPGSTVRPRAGHAESGRGIRREDAPKNHDESARRADTLPVRVSTVTT